ncbi:hypothetical protein J6590_005973 [Homalodisca vitripennis]|nr:hypothetical protein J6590_005973 [Homalodisca vitripennis]
MGITVSRSAHRGTPTAASSSYLEVQTAVESTFVVLACHARGTFSRDGITRRSTPTTVHRQDYTVWGTVSHVVLIFLD